MSNQFRTEITEMDAAAIHVREVNANIQASLDSLLSRLSALTDTWQGAAAASFHGLKDRWIAETKDLNATLMSISEALDKTKENYSATDEANKSGFSGIAGKL